MLGMGLASYAVDCLLLVALSWAGALPLHVAMGYFGAGLAVNIVFWLVLRTSWSERFSDHYLAGPQMLAHAAVALGFTLYAPEIGVLFIMVLFILFAFGALRLNPKQLGSAPMLGALAIGLSVVSVVIVVGDRLSMPVDTPSQRILCGLWVALVLGRSTLIGIYSAQLRALLNKRNSELAATFEKLEVMASRDELTGALNRRSVMRLLEEESQRMERTGLPFGVVLFDLDHFKQINDGFGHLTGDETLRQFTAAASSGMRSTDRLARYGGEEFLMLLTATADETAARVAAERVRSLTDGHDWASIAPGLKVTVSAGVAMCQPGETPGQLLERADQALYAAKRAGRNRVAVAA